MNNNEFEYIKLRESLIQNVYEKNSDIYDYASLVYCLINAVYCKPYQGIPSSCFEIPEVKNYTTFYRLNNLYSDRNNIVENEYLISDFVKNINQYDDDSKFELEVLFANDESRTSRITVLRMALDILEEFNINTLNDFNDNFLKNLYTPFMSLKLDDPYESFIYLCLLACENNFRVIDASVNKVISKYDNLMTHYTDDFVHDTEKFWKKAFVDESIYNFCTKKDRTKLSRKLCLLIKKESILGPTGETKELNDNFEADWISPLTLDSCEQYLNEELGSTVCKKAMECGEYNRFILAAYFLHSMVGCDVVDIVSCLRKCTYEDCNIIKIKKNTLSEIIEDLKIIKKYGKLLFGYVCNFHGDISIYACLNKEFSDEDALLIIGDLDDDINKETELVIFMKNYASKD